MKYYAQGLAVIVAVIAFIALVIYIVYRIAPQETADPFQVKCDKAGGVIAVYEHGKSSDYFCIKGNRVLFSE